MARDPALQSDDASRRRLPQIVSSRDSHLESFATVRAKLSQPGTEEIAPELALELILNDVVEEARQITLASGAAIALGYGAEMVCRARAGGTVPDLGVAIDVHKGLSGLCIQSRQIQICTDVVGDGRVNEAASQQLGIRAILVLPLLAGDELLGILELFSPRPHAFGERDVQAVRPLCERAVETVLQARQLTTKTAFPESERGAVHEQPAAMFEAAQGPPNDGHLTTILIFSLVVVAVVLGWVLGYSGWMKSRRPTPQSSINVDTSKADTSVAKAAPANSNPVTTNASETNAPEADRRTEPDSTNADPVRKKTIAPGSLTVYQDGKVIFHMPPTRTGTEAGAQAASPAKIPAEEAARYLVYSVEPEYPANLRAHGVQGDVTLDVIVDRSGAVQQLSVVQGQPLLSDAAIEAVRKWRFKPYAPNGVPEEFETKITVHFSLSSGGSGSGEAR